MPVLLGHIYPAVLRAQKHQRFEGSSSAGDLMGVEEGSHTNLLSTNFCVWHGQSYILVIYYCKNIHAEAAAPQEDETIKAQDSAIQMTCENMAESCAIRAVIFQWRSSTKVLTAVCVHFISGRINAEHLHLWIYPETVSTFENKYWLCKLNMQLSGSAAYKCSTTMHTKSLCVYISMCRGSFVTVVL